VSDNKLVAETRTQFGKGAARKIRRDHKIPAVMYGHGAEPVHITLPGLVQLAGGVCIIGGVVAVRLGELRRDRAARATAAVDEADFPLPAGVA
jgi:hypothetical protein